MRLFGNRRREPDPADLQMIQQVRERVQEMRQRMGRRCVELTDLFALVREDETLVMRVAEAKRSVERVWPDQVPSKKLAEPAREAPPSLQRDRPNNS